MLSEVGRPRTHRSCGAHYISHFQMKSETLQTISQDSVSPRVHCQKRGSWRFCPVHAIWALRLAFWPKQKSGSLSEKRIHHPATVTQIALAETGIKNHEGTISCYPVFSAVIKYLTRSNLREKGLYMGSQFESPAIVARRGRQGEGFLGMTSGV